MSEKKNDLKTILNFHLSLLEHQRKKNLSLNQAEVNK